MGNRASDRGGSRRPRSGADGSEAETVVYRGGEIADALAALYERTAYSAYNLALRVTCSPQAAERALETGLLDHVAGGRFNAEEADELLLAGVAKAAIPPAAAEPAPPGDGESAALFAAIARLPGAQRATVALSVLEARPGLIGTVLGLDDEAQARAAIEQADEAFAEALGVPARAALARRSSWPWESPPAALWESLYPKLFAAAKSSRPPSPATAGGRRSRKRGAAATAGRPNKRRRLALGLIAIAVAAAIAAPALLGGGDGEDAASAGVVSSSADSGDGESASGEEGGEGTSDPLTPEELDQLRLEELKALRRYAEEQADETLSADQRSAAEREAARLAALAERRLQKAEAEQRKADQRNANADSRKGGKKGGRQPAPQPQPAPEPAPEPEPAPDKGTKGGGKGGGKQPKDGGGKQGNGKTDCLFEESSGSYICPQ